MPVAVASPADFRIGFGANDLASVSRDLAHRARALIGARIGVAAANSVITATQTRLAQTAGLLHELKLAPATAAARPVPAL